MCLLYKLLWLPKIFLPTWCLKIWKHNESKIGTMDPFNYGANLDFMSHTVISEA